MMKHERGVLDDVDLVMTWGEENRMMWTKSGAYDPARIHATGNPRVDMLRRDLRGFHQGQIDALHARYGEYVLFNSNFATVNHFIVGASRFVLASWVPETERQLQTTTLLSHKRQIFEAFIRVLPNVARAIAPLTLVVRPHPSESHLPWEEALAGHDNVAVVFEGGVVPWLAGARALLHNGCTTAVEAAVLGTTSLSYMPVRSERFDNPLPNGLSIQCDTDEALLASLRDVIRDGPRALSPEQRSLLDYFVAGQSGALASENVMAAIESSGVGCGRADLGSMTKRAAVAAMQWAAVRVRSGLTGQLEMLHARGRNRRANHARKFPALAQADIEDRIARLTFALGRFAGASAQQVDRSLFLFD
jgi:surface carbohydrate biosynthesis protein